MPRAGRDRQRLGAVRVPESLIARDPPATESAAKRLLIGLASNRAPTPTVRIVISDYLGHAPQVQLSRALAARGHDVLHLYSGDVQSPKADLTRQAGDPPGLAIEGLSIGAPRAQSFFARRRQEAKFGRLLAQRATAFQPDAVMACNNPLDAQSKVQSACTGADIPFIYWMQDFQSLEIDRAISDRGAIMNIVVGGYYHGLERKLLQRSDAIVPIADDMLGILRKAGTSSSASAWWCATGRRSTSSHRAQKTTRGRAHRASPTARSRSTRGRSARWKTRCCWSSLRKS